MCAVYIDMHALITLADATRCFLPYWQVWYCIELREQSIFREANSPQIFKELAACYGTRWSITEFTGGCQLVPILKQVIALHTLISTAVRFLLVAPFHLRLGLQSGLFLLGFSTKIFYAFILSPMCITCLSDLSSLILSP